MEAQRETMTCPGGPAGLRSLYNSEPQSAYICQPENELRELKAKIDGVCVGGWGVGGSSSWTAWFLRSQGKSPFLSLCGNHPFSAAS